MYIGTPGVDLETSEMDGQDTCPLASYIDTCTFYFLRILLKIIQNFEEKGVAAPPSVHP